MGYAWQEESEREGAAQAERMDGGDHHVRIAKVVYGKSNGLQFVSQGGIPQILIVFQNHLAQEVSTFVTLSNKAGWVLAKLLGCCDPPVNLAAMQTQGVEPIHFATPQFAEANLLNRQLMINVEWPQGKQHPNVTPIKPAGQATAPPPPAGVPPVGAPPVVGNATQAVAQTSLAAPVAVPATPPPPIAAPTPPAPQLPLAPAALPAVSTPAPTAVTAEMPPQLTKDQAWAMVLEQWGGAVASQGDAAKTRRNEAWTNAIRERMQSTGHTEQQMTSEGWQAVVNVASVPF